MEQKKSKIIDNHMQHLKNATEMGDKTGEGRAYSKLGIAFRRLGDFKQAIDYHMLHLTIAKEEGDKAGEGRAYGNLGNAYQSLGDFKQAIDYHMLDLTIAKEVGDRAGEGGAYGNLGNAYQSLGDFIQAIDYHMLHLTIAKEVGDRAGEGSAYGNLGNAYQSLGDFKQAIDYHMLHLTIAKEVGDRAGEGRAYGNLGNAYQRLGDFKQTIDYHMLHLTIAKEVGDRAGEGRAYGNLGNAYQSLGDFKQAIDYHMLRLTIAKEVGDRAGEGGAYGNLGNAYQSLGDFKQAIDYHMLDLTIAKEVGDRAGEGVACGSLCIAYITLRNFREAIFHCKQFLQIAKKTGNKDSEGRAYASLGSIQLGLGDVSGGVQYYLQSLEIAERLGEKIGEGYAYCKLGEAYRRQGDLKQSIECHKKHLNIAREVGDKCGEGYACYSLGRDFELSGRLHEALDHYRCSVKVHNDIRHLQVEDVWKVSFRDMRQDVYTALWRFLVRLSKIDEALCAAEQGRAQALMDLMKIQYDLQLPHSEFPGVEDSFSNLASSTSTQTVFVALQGKTINLWVLCKGSNVQFRQNTVEERDAAYFIEGLRKRVLNENQIRGRSVDKMREESPPSHATDQTSQSTPATTSSLRALYLSIFEPIRSMLKGDEIVIVPDGPLHLTPFAAFLDQASRYLSESFRIRLVPSLTSLQLFEDCAESYHSNTGVLLVGDPCLEQVTNIFGVPILPQLPHAITEVKMIGEIFNTTPLTGREATKEEVLKRITSVALVHIAAHGNSEHGEIALAPNSTQKYISREEHMKHHMLKLADVQAVHLRARLVVLSCCHSGQGEIKAEGVIGIARAFLGSGARSVLVSLWAIDDKATLEFMKFFYQNIRNGDSASVSLNQAMESLRESDKFSDVKHWAPFVLLGDDVTLDFGAM